MPDINILINKFSTNLRESLKKAQNLAWEMKHPEVNNEHLLYALLTQKGSIGAEILSNAKLEPEAVRNFIAEKNKPVKKNEDFQLSPQLKKALLNATKITYEYSHKHIGTEHMLFGLLETEDEKLKNIFKKHSINIENLKTQLTDILQNTSRFPDLGEIFGAIHNKEGAAAKKGPRSESSKQKNSPLDNFGIELTDEKVQKTIDPVIGREEEIERIIQILCRRTKNNPILLGEAGVGKTAIVEGLAKKILEGDVPDVLHNKKVYSLDMVSLISGAMFRGEFESRFKQVLDEIKEDPNIIVFIDEVHTLMGAGAASGSLDAANILKPALARGDIRCIGATTLNEYKKSIEGDPALERRFQAVKVEEPTKDKALDILAGVKDKYEIFHQTKITDEAIKAAVELSSRYITDKFLPDKAIDLLDEAAAKLKVKQKPNKSALEIRKLAKRLEDVKLKKQDAVIDEQFETALQLKELEKTLDLQLSQLKDKNKSVDQIFHGTINHEDIASIVSQITRIPLADLTTNEKNKLLNLEKIIGKKVIGQKEAVGTIAQAIRRSRTGIRNQNQPIGSFMFLGPSGVGKTELAKVIAETLFDHKALVRIDMSEFAEGFNVSKLIGAPAGYVGYKEGGKLSEAIKHQPYSVVLLDEIEKAHPDVFNLLLQILDEGHMTDATGRKIDFKNTIIIMTSNIGVDSFNQQAEVGFDSEGEEISSEFNALKDNIKTDLNEYFKPEFINRLDQIVVFNPLDVSHLQRIVKLKIEELNQRLKDKKIKMDLNHEACKWLAQKNLDSQFGARTIVRNIAEIEDKLAEDLLRDRFTENDIVKIKAIKDQIVLEK